MSFFSMDNAFFRFVGRLTDLVWLNILTLICCIPIVTMGAALSAMYSVLIKLALHEEGVITKPFFREFKANFKKTTLVWLPMLAILLVMSSNIYLIYQGILNPYPRLLIATGVSIGVIVIAIIIFLNYYFALAARYENDVKQLIKNALLMMIAYFPRSLCILAITISPIALMTLSDYFLIFGFVYGFSFPGYVNAMVFSGLFLKTEKLNSN